MRGPDAATLLIRALRAYGAEAGLTVAVRSIAARPWASATFVGLRHRIALEAAAGTATDAWIAALPEREWRLRGHLVADLAVDSVTDDAGIAAVVITVLTIEDN